MTDIYIERPHTLDLQHARRVAAQWAEQAGTRFGMAWSCEEGSDGDLLSFSRSGVDGTLRVTPERFEIQARLGLLAAVFKDRIEAEIVKNLDGLLAPGL